MREAHSSGRKPAPTQRRQAATMKPAWNSAAWRLRAQQRAPVDPETRHPARLAEREVGGGVAQRAVTGGVPIASRMLAAEIVT